MWLFKATAYSVFECCLGLVCSYLPASVMGSIMKRILFEKKVCYRCLISECKMAAYVENKLVDSL